ILPRDTYNMDETGCRIGVATSQYVYTRRGRQVFIPNANNRELVTLVECISADGASITPMVIVKAQSVMEHWISDLPDDYLISVSDSGYTNDSLALDWLKHFEKMTRRRQVGAWRLLLVDGHGSHDTKQFAEFAEKHKIQLFALPPHTTHIL
ncbi:CENP-B protein, partial [Amniculicola lignicola CBS 123094]